MSGVHIPKYTCASAPIIQEMWLKPIFIEYILVHDLSRRDGFPKEHFVSPKVVAILVEMTCTTSDNSYYLGTN
jgi:hypothetical protein